MFLLDILPSWVFYSIFLVGLGLFGISQFAAQIPFISKYGNAASLISVIMLIVGIFFIGAEFNQEKWEKRVEEKEKRIAILEQSSKIINEVVVEKYIEKPVKEIQEVTKVIVKKIPQVITKEVDSSCKIPQEVIKLHNEAVDAQVHLF